MKRDISYAQNIAFTGAVQALLHLLTLNYTKARGRLERNGRDSDLRSEAYTAGLLWQHAAALEAPAGLGGLRDRLTAAARDQAALFGVWLHGNPDDIAALESLYREHVRWVGAALQSASREPPGREPGARALIELLDERAVSA